MLTRIVWVLGIVSMLHVAAILGAGAVAWSRGWLVRDRIMAAYAALRGDMAEKTEDVDTDASDAPPPSTSARIQRNFEADEQLRIEMERRRQEIEDAYALLEQVQLQVIREREKLEEEQKRFFAERDAIAEAEGDGGRQKELSIFAKLSPRAAKEQLQLKSDAEAAQILLTLDDRQASKIVAQCKTPKERAWIDRIMEEMTTRAEPQ